jgi:hypothetical protein
VEREEVYLDTLALPTPPIPMPGDKVFWYNESNPMEGQIIGHNARCQPVIRNNFQNICFPYSFGQIRLENPTKRVGPNWKRLPTRGTAYRAFPEEISRFDEILGQHIPPGPKYYQLITEIWHRGFEVYLVGGTVRDVISGSISYDVDLVTTMPLRLALPLLKSMYRYEPTIDGENGFVRIGGKPTSGDPFIDLKSFNFFQPGTKTAIFGSDFGHDIAHRDFACNAIYYDPINKVFFDPSGRGVNDAKEKHLFIVCDPQVRNSYYHHATIVIRFFKFVCRGFSYGSETRDILLNTFLPKVSSMHKSLKIRYLRTQLLSKSPKNEHKQIIKNFKKSMIDFGISDHWEIHFAPLVEEILK